MEWYWQAGDTIKKMSKAKELIYSTRFAIVANKSLTTIAYSIRTISVDTAIIREITTIMGIIVVYDDGDIFLGYTA